MTTGGYLLCPQNSRCFLNYEGLFVDKGSGSGIFPDPDPGDPKRLDSAGSGSATLCLKVKISKYFDGTLHILNNFI